MFFQKHLLAAVMALVCFNGPAGAITFDEARHLLARTGFGVAEPEKIKTLQPLSYEAAVEALLNQVRTRPNNVPPPGILSLRPPGKQQRRSWSREEKKAFRKKRRKHGQALKAWWLREMMITGSPLTERLVLFWHNHFTSSLRKVKWPQLMYRQNELFRQHAAGNFATLLQAVVIDLAMLVYLDGRANRVGKPNENFARELLELITLGEGQGYTETDIREAARALTGWRLRQRDGTVKFISRRHDTGSKTFLNQRGRFREADIITILLEQPRLAEHITEKLWRAFVSYTIDQQTVRRLARTFRQSGYRMRPLLKGLFMSKAFRDPANRGTLIKSPVDLVVGAVRLLDLRMHNAKPLVRFTKRLGQDLFDPPNVKGWSGGTSWITSSSLPARQQLLRRLSRGVEVASRRGPNARMKMGKVGMTPGPAMLDPINVLGNGSAAQLAKIVLPIPPVKQSNDGDGAANGIQSLRALLLDPAFQLK